MNLTTLFRCTGLASLCTLAACAGGGGGSSSPLPVGNTGNPSPPAAAPAAPTVTTRTLTKTDIVGPANVAGEYEAIGFRRDTAAGDTFSRSFIDREGAIRIRVDPETDTYTVLLDVQGMNASAVFDLEGSNFGFNAVQTNRYSDGTTEVHEWEADYIEGVETGKSPADRSGSSKERVLVLNTRLATRYVSLGEILERDLAWKSADEFWNLDELTCDECGGVSGAAGSLGRLLFAYGPRTPAGSIPLSGSATWRVSRTNLNAWRTDVNGGDYAFLFDTPTQNAIDELTLTADFSRQRIGARISIDAVRREVRDSSGSLLRYEYWAGADIHGEAEFMASGRFSIPLSGQYSTLWPSAPAATARVDGRLDGAFFGPHAEETGGAIFLETIDHAYQVEGTFAATRE